MQITELPGAEQVELRLAGRIDATWAEHLSATIEKSVRAGAHRVVLNFAAVDYISSLGIRVLVMQYKLLKSVKGSLEITQPTDFCRNIRSMQLSAPLGMMVGNAGTSWTSSKAAQPTSLVSRGATR